MNYVILKTLPKTAISALLTVALLAVSYIILEPQVGKALSDDFIITQSITSEIAFVASTSDVSMAGPIAGLTGGTANGTTTAVVTTNDAGGYNMTIHFSSTTAMSKNGGGGVIANYTPTTPGTPDYTFGSEAYAQFAYRVTADDINDLDPTFEDDNSSTCGSGGGFNTYGACWFNPEPIGGAETIIYRGTPTSDTSTTTINFRVNVPPNPVPAVPEGTYTATATLTIATN